MKTKSINVFNQCLPCYNRCKYCLLSYNGKERGIAYERGVEFSKKMMEYLKINHPEIHFMHYLGSAMESQSLPQIIKDMKALNSPMAEFMQYDGTKFKEEQELLSILRKMKQAGIKLIDLTFYGMRAYHDEFAGRNGDFEYMMKIIDLTNSISLNVEIGIPVFKDNLDQIDVLVKLFEGKKVKEIFIFTPHAGGRGLALVDKKIDLNDYNCMSDSIKKYFNRNSNKTPMEWKSTNLPEVNSRMLHLSLLPTNIERLEKQDYEETLLELEKMDEEFYGIIPSFNSLLDMYVKQDDDKRLYTKKDLYAHYRRRFIKENGLSIKDIDERYNYSLRYYSENLLAIN